MGETTGGGAAPNDSPGDGGAAIWVAWPGFAGVIGAVAGGTIVVAGFCSGVQVPGNWGGPRV